MEYTVHGFSENKLCEAYFSAIKIDEVQLKVSDISLYESWYSAPKFVKYAEDTMPVQS